MSDKRSQLETQQPAVVPATGTHDDPRANQATPSRSGDRDLDVNGVEQDDDGQPGTGLGPDETPTDE